MTTRIEKPTRTKNIAERHTFLLGAIEHYIEERLGLMESRPGEPLPRELIHALNDEYGKTGRIDHFLRRLNIEDLH